MSLCNRCGQPISFRHVDGRIVPIHEGGGWNCSPGVSTAVYPQNRPSYPQATHCGAWRENEGARPSTCPECGARVFFIRHNGGSVWVDELGWPWPRHGCFDKGLNPTRFFANWVKRLSTSSRGLLGVVTEIGLAPGMRAYLLKIRMQHDAVDVSLEVTEIPSHRSLIGSLVVVMTGQNVLLAPECAEIPFRNPVNFQASKEFRISRVRCRVCEAWIGLESIQQHLRSHGPEVKAPPVAKAREVKSIVAPKKPQKQPKRVIAAARPVIPSQRASKPVLPAPTLSQGPSLEANQWMENMRAVTATRSAELLAKVQQIILNGITTIGPCRKTDRFALIQQECLKAVSMLSPEIRGEAEDLMTRDRWAMLQQHLPPMKVAVVGWSSKCLRLAGLGSVDSWSQDGPVLPLQFSRISECNRLIQVMDSDDGIPVQTFWGLSSRLTLMQAVRDLAAVEDVQRNNVGILRVQPKDPEPPSVPLSSATLMRLNEWAAGHGIEAVIWLAMSPNFEAVRGVRFSIGEVLQFLQSLDPGDRRTSAEELLPDGPSTPLTEAIRGSGLIGGG